MQSGLFAVIFLVLNLSAGVLGEYDIKRGTYRFMAFLYYQDETVVDGTGARFLQGAVLIRPNFLISSSLISSISEDPLSKTLLARAGAVRIDANFTLNEDEDEQEQEVIQITVPREHNRTHWWMSDISLLMTLQPFLKTSAVHVTQLSTARDFSDKICNILIFKKRNSISADSLFLTQLSVEMLPVSMENCGEQFNENTMTCATDSQAMREDEAVADFCQGNSGGPLMCNNDVMALQTYINGNCNPPHLYQLLAPWRNFLSCGTEDNCNNRVKCPDVCSVLYKDAPPATEMVTTTTVILTESTTTEIVSSSEVNVFDTSADAVISQLVSKTTTDNITPQLFSDTSTDTYTAPSVSDTFTPPSFSDSSTDTTTDTTTDTSTDISTDTSTDTVTPPLVSDTSTDIATTTLVSDTSTDTATPQFTEELVANTTTDETTIPTTTITTTTIADIEVVHTEPSTPTPKVKETDSLSPVKKTDNKENNKVETVRDHKIEAQQHKSKLVRNVGDKNTCVVHGLIYSVFFMWLCLV